MKTKTKISLAIASAFGVALISAGAVLLAIFPLRNARAEDTIPLAAQQNETTAAVIEGFNDVKMTESPDKNLVNMYVFNVTPRESEKQTDPRLATLATPYELLRTKIQTRLGYGPEFAMLQNINLIPEIDTNPADGETEGFYLPSTYEIFIGTQTMLHSMENYGLIKTARDTNDKITSYAIVRPANQDLFTTYAIYADVLSEKAFQIIYHEYGHHIANVYLNTDNRADDLRGGEYAPVSVIRKNHATGFAAGVSQKWDRNFYEAFVNTLGYNDAFSQEVFGPDFENSYYFDTAYVTRPNGRYQYAPKTNFNPSVSFTLPSGQQILPLSNLYSLKDLFDKANSYVSVKDENGEEHLATTIQELYPELTANPKIGYAAFGSQRAFNFSATSGSVLNYLYSLEELFTRKMMQATMPFHATVDTIPNARYGYLIDGGVKPPGGGFSRYLSTFLGDTLMSQDDVSDPSISPTSQRPFYHDFLYAHKVRPGILGATEIEYGNEHAQAIYNALADRMGYTTGDDIAHVWWKNTLKVSADLKLSGVPSRETNEIKFGGYISLADLKITADQLAAAKFYLTYVGDDNARVQIPVTIKKFNYFAKPTLLARAGKDQSTTTDKYFYTLDQYVPISGKQSILNKPLALARGVVGPTGTTLDLTNTYALQTVNRKASTDVRFWVDYQFLPIPNFTSTGSVYPVINNNKAVITITKSGE